MRYEDTTCARSTHTMCMLDLTLKTWTLWVLDGSRPAQRVTVCVRPAIQPEVLNVEYASVLGYWATSSQNTEGNGRGEGEREGRDQVQK